MGATPSGNGFDVHRHVPGGAGGTGDGLSGSAGGAQWSVVPICSATNGTSDGCAGTNAGCPVGLHRARVYTRPSPSSPWLPAGSRCIAMGGPAAPAGPSPAAIAAAAADYLRHLALPAPQPSAQPANGSVVNKATIFAAGSAQPISGTFNLGGVAVSVTATPTSWDWTFAPGLTQRFTEPGGPYPDLDVTHTYRSPGTYRVSVTSTWTGTFSAGGVSAAIAGTVQRASAPIAVVVRQAPAELVSG